MSTLFSYNDLPAARAYCAAELAAAGFEKEAQTLLKEVDLLGNLIDFIGMGVTRVISKIKSRRHAAEPMQFIPRQFEEPA